MTDTLDLPAVARAKPPVPPLRDGDRLDADEFMRRYEAMGEECDAELIEGVVYIWDVSLSHAKHGRPHAHAGLWLGLYASETPGTDVGDNSTTRLADDSVPQPDLLLRIEESAGGASREVGDYLEGPPELVVEISNSTTRLDLGPRLRDYRGAGIREYVVWRTNDREVDWFLLDGDQYARNKPDPADGLLKSRVFPGLWLDADALLNGDLAALRAAVEAGCATAEHAEFKRRLAGGSV